ncbi:MAG: hypothetical protein ABIR47_18115 [Candidatus Kapaibacterium sp.]
MVTLALPARLAGQKHYMVKDFNLAGPVKSVEVVHGVYDNKGLPGLWQMPQGCQRFDTLGRCVWNEDQMDSGVIGHSVRAVYFTANILRDYRGNIIDSSGENADTRHIFISDSIHYWYDSADRPARSDESFTEVDSAHDYHYDEITGRQYDTLGRSIVVTSNWTMMEFLSYDSTERRTKQIVAVKFLFEEYADTHRYMVERLRRPFQLPRNINELSYKLDTTFHTYDAHHNLVQTYAVERVIEAYEDSITPPHRSWKLWVYEYDSQGNWISMTVFEPSTADPEIVNTEVLVPQEVYRRTITYY